MSQPPHIQQPRQPGPRQKQNTTTGASTEARTHAHTHTHTRDHKDAKDYHNFAKGGVRPRQDSSRVASARHRWPSDPPIWFSIALSSVEGCMLHWKAASAKGCQAQGGNKRRHKRPQLDTRKDNVPRTRHLQHSCLRNVACVCLLSKFGSPICCLMQSGDFKFVLRW